MGTTIEPPDELLSRGIEQKLSPEPRKNRRSPPSIGDENGRPIGVLTPEQIDEAMFG